MDLSQYLRFLNEASHLRKSALECLQHLDIDTSLDLALLVPLVITQFEMVFGWFTAQTTAQFLASLEITRDYGNIPPELRHQTLYLMNELAQNRISLDEFDHQLDLLNDRESAQIEEIFDGFEEVEEDGKEDEEEDGKEEDGKVEEEEEEDGKEEEASGERDNEFDEIKSDESNSEEPEHLRKLFINGLNRQMTDEVVKAHFGQFGTVLEFAWARNPKRNRIRSFGIIIYSKGSMVDAAQQASPHTINGRVVEARRADPAIEAAWQYGSRAYHRAGNGGYSRGDGGSNGRNSRQSQDWNRQPRGQQHRHQVGRSSGYGNSGYGTGGGPIRRPNNRLHSTSGPYGNKPRNHR